MFFILYFLSDEIKIIFVTSNTTSSILKKLGKEFVDADTEIERVADCSIPEIFANDGEDRFRQIETEVLGELGKRSGLVIATGGGCVTRQINYPLLHQNGILIWLQREIDALPTDGRPLSDPGKMETMYAVRKPFYTAFADIVIDNNCPVTDTVDKILSSMNLEE